MLHVTELAVTSLGLFWSQLFVIAHGGMVDEMPAWTVDLGVAMCRAHGIDINHSTAWKSGVDLDGNIDPEGSPHLLFIDWSKKSS